MSTPRVTPSRPQSATVRPQSAGRRDYDRAWTRSPAAPPKTPVRPSTIPRSAPTPFTAVGQPHEAANSHPLGSKGSDFIPLEVHSDAHPFLHLFSDEAITGETRSQEVVFDMIMCKLAEESTAFHSFALACDAAMTRAAVATESIPPPCQLESAVAATLLLKLCPHVGTLGATMLRLIQILLKGVFVTVPPGIAEATISSLQDDQSLSAAGGVSQREQNTSCDFHSLVRVPTFGAKGKQLLEELQKSSDALVKSKRTLFSNASSFFRMAEKSSSRRLAGVFHAWREHTRKKRGFEEHFTKMRTIQQNNATKKETFLRWVAYIHSVKEARSTSLSTANHEKLSGRLNELQGRCTQREDQTVTQRVAKEKFAARCERLEELYAFEKEELAKCRTRLLSTEQEVQRFRQLSTNIFQLFDRLTATIPLFMGQASIRKIASTTNKRDLNIRKNIVPVKAPVTTAPIVPSRMVITHDYDVPYIVHGGGSATLEEYIDDAYLVVLRWLNLANDEVRQFVESMRTQQLTSSKDAFVTASNADDDIARAQADCDASIRTVRDLLYDLSDGKVYQLLLWRLITHRYGNTAFLATAAVAPYVAVEGNLERLDICIKMARVLGIDGGVASTDLISSNPEAQRCHFLFVCRLMHFHTYCTPHFLRVQSTRFVQPTTALTSAHVQQMLHAAGEKIDTMEKWKFVTSAVGNYAAEVAVGKSQLDTGDHRSPTINRHLMIDVSLLQEFATVQHLRFSKQPNTARSVLGSSFSSLAKSARSAAPDDDESLNESSGGAGGSVEQATAFFCSEINHIFSSRARDLHLLIMHYAATVASDAVEPLWDSASWVRFIADTKLVSAKHVTKQQSDAVFRSMSTVNMNNVPLGASTTATASSAPHGRVSMAASASVALFAVSMKRHAASSTSAASEGREADLDEDASSGNPTMQMPGSRVPSAIVRLFLARSSAPATTSVSWTDVDKGVEVFRDFISALVLHPSVPRSPIDQWQAIYSLPSVQDVLKTYKEPMRKLFAEVAQRDPSTQLMRIRLDAFVNFVIRDMKLMTLNETSDATTLYHTCRFTSHGINPLSVGYVAGLDSVGFQIAAMALSRLKFGFSLISHAAALQQFLLTVLLPTASAKLKIKM